MRQEVASGALDLRMRDVCRKVVEDWEEPLISYDEIRYGGLLEFGMSDKAENWGGGRGVWTQYTDDHPQNVLNQPNIRSTLHVEHVEL